MDNYGFINSRQRPDELNTRCTKDKTEYWQSALILHLNMRIQCTVYNAIEMVSSGTL